MSKRRHYTKPYPVAFRRDAVALVHSSGRTIAPRTAPELVIAEPEFEAE